MSKNINKYRTPQDKIVAWRAWRESPDGCRRCWAVLGVSCHEDAAIAALCFNAWLHSTTVYPKPNAGINDTGAGHD